jgi:hypothetical protein
VLVLQHMRETILFFRLIPVQLGFVLWRLEHETP